MSWMTDQNLGYAEPLKVRGSCSWDPATASTEDVFCAMWAFRETAKKMRQSKIQSQPKKNIAPKKHPKTSKLTILFLSILQVQKHTSTPILVVWSPPLVVGQKQHVCMIKVSIRLPLWASDNDRCFQVGCMEPANLPKVCSGMGGCAESP